MTTRLLGLLATLSIVLGTVAHAGPGMLDPSFAGDGVTETSIGGAYALGFAVALQPDGRIVVAGEAGPSGPATSYALARYRSDGVLDATFGTGGRVTTDIGSGFDRAQDVLVDPSGRIVVAGQSVDAGVSRVALARYDTSGALDAGFGSGGLVVMPLLASSAVRGVVRQPDGMLLVAGSATASPPDDEEFLLARYADDGTLDPGFGIGGIVLTPVGAIDSFAHAVALQVDGKLVAAGSSANPMGSYDLALVRYAGDGTLDPTFGTGGIVVTPLAGGDAFPASVLVEPDGKIVVAGSAGGRVLVARYDAAGVLDPGFGTGGLVLTSVGDSAGASSMARQPDGKLVLAGSVSQQVMPHVFDLSVLVLRYLADGTPDPGFGSGGRVVSNWNAQSAAGDVALQPDGRIVVAGAAAGASAPPSRFAVARYFGLSCGDGILDAGEQCDDGNTTDGDCCSSACTFEPSGAPCSDANACTTGEACDGAGACAGGVTTTCGPCLVCDAGDGSCVAGPRAGCVHTTVTGSSTLKIRDAVSDTSDQLVWKLRKTGATTPADLGDPLASGDYTVCLFDESGPTPATTLAAVAPAGGTCGSRPCWRTITNGVLYKNPQRTPAGLDQVKVKVGALGTGSVTVKGKGATLATPALPLGLPARVQLQVAGGACWEATFDVTGAKRNDSERFSGKGD
jgi:uncharacterized delta-60 repeat protein